MMPSGGCQCGAVRYRIANMDGARSYWCHCRMCQRAVGNVAAAFVNVAKSDVVWEAGEPVRYASSPIARRGFCASCGTPLIFEYPDSPRLDLTIGSLDDPAGLQLESHFGSESWVTGWLQHDSLPEQRSDDYAPLQARWAAVKGSTSEA